MSTSDNQVQNDEKVNNQKRVEISNEELLNAINSMITSQELLSKGYDTLCKYEKHINFYINLLKIANALKVSIDELISGSYKNKAIKLNPYQQKLFNLLDMLEDSTSEQLSKLFIEIIKTASTTDINNKNDK